MSKEIEIFCLGKFKEQNIIELENTYLKRLSFFSVKMVEIAGTSFSLKKDPKIWQKLHDPSPATLKILLMEHGKSYNTANFFQFVQESFKQYQKILFIVAGPEGPPASLMERCPEKLSLSPLTFPHQLARLILVEQLYRAHCFFTQHPYPK